MALNTTLFRKSHLYRAFFKWKLKRQSTFDLDLSKQKTKKHLELLRIAVKDRNAEFVVVLFPILAPYSDWTDLQKRSREMALDILEESEARHFDLMPALEAAIADGLTLEIAKGDTWHPSQAAADHFARWLADQGLFER